MQLFCVIIHKNILADVQANEMGGTLMPSNMGTGSDVGLQ
jgi:hypothetical protein